MSGYVWHGKRPEHPCACGCGQEVSIARRSDSRRGQVRGQPLRYVSGHNPRGESTVPSAAERGLPPRPDRRCVPRKKAGTTPAPSPARPAPVARPRKTCPSCLFRLDSDTHRIVCLSGAVSGRAA